MRGTFVFMVILVFVEAQSDPNCRDKLPDCASYEAGSCTGIYEPWARDKCMNTCKYCNGPTTPAPVCRDKIPNCKDFDQDSTCHDPQYNHWVEEHCRLYCRKCTQEQLAVMDGLVPTAAICRDKALDCARKGNSACNVPSQLLWATITCKKFCGLC